jgi:hypothetical protein
VKRGLIKPIANCTTAGVWGKLAYQLCSFLFVEPVLEGQNSCSEICVCERSKSQTLRLFCIFFFFFSSSSSSFFFFSSSSAFFFFFSTSSFFFFFSSSSQLVNDVFLVVMACTWFRDVMFHVIVWGERCLWHLCSKLQASSDILVSQQKCWIWFYCAGFMLMNIMK